MVTREQFIKHVDKIMGYHLLANRIDGLSGSFWEKEGIVKMDLEDIAISMQRMLDDCLDTPYVDTLGWTMTHRHNPETEYAQNTVRLIEAWGSEMDYGKSPTIVYDQDNKINVIFGTVDDLYDYLYATRHTPECKWCKPGPC